MKVLVANDHAIVRKGLKQILLDEYPFGEIEECSNADELLQKANEGKWDVADSLSLSTTTISTYRARILSKMNFKNKADLIRCAMEKSSIKIIYGNF